MTAEMRILRFVAIVLAALLTFPRGMAACGRWVALGDATTSGHTILGKNSDRPRFDCQPLLRHRRRTWPKGATTDRPVEDPIALRLRPRPPALATRTFQGSRAGSPGHKRAVMLMAHICVQRCKSKPNGQATVREAIQGRDEAKVVWPESVGLYKRGRLPTQRDGPSRPTGRSEGGSDVGTRRRSAPARGVRTCAEVPADARASYSSGSDGRRCGVGRTASDMGPAGLSRRGRVAAWRSELSKRGTGDSRRSE